MNWYKRSKISSSLSKSAVNWQDIINTLSKGIFIMFPAATILLIANLLQQSPRQTENMIKNDPAQVANQIQIISNPQHHKLYHAKEPPPLPETPQAPPKTDPQPAQAKSQSTIDIQQMIIKHEGFKTKVYRDSLGIPTIGIGSCLDLKIKPQAKSRIEALGANYDLILQGKQSLTNTQVMNLFEQDFKDAINTVGRLVPNLSSHPNGVQSVLIDMAFNVNISKFPKFLAAVNKKDYKTAADEMINSKWYGQVGNRSKELVEIMRKS